MDLTPEERAKRLKQHSYAEAFKDEMKMKKAKSAALKGKVNWKEVARANKKTYARGERGFRRALSQ